MSKICRVLVLLVSCCFLLNSFVECRLRLDYRVHKYSIEGKRCSHFDKCKKVYMRYFECKCPNMRPACFGPGEYYDARCVPETWAKHGRVWVQP